MRRATTHAAPGLPHPLCKWPFAAPARACTIETTICLQQRHTSIQIKSRMNDTIPKSAVRPYVSGLARFTACQFGITRSHTQQWVLPFLRNHQRVSRLKTLHVRARLRDPSLVGRVGWDLGHLQGPAHPRCGVILLVILPGKSSPVAAAAAAESDQGAPPGTQSKACGRVGRGGEAVGGLADSECRREVCVVNRDSAREKSQTRRCHANWHTVWQPASYLVINIWLVMFE